MCVVARTGAKTHRAEFHVPELTLLLICSSLITRPTRVKCPPFVLVDESGALPRNEAAFRSRAASEIGSPTRGPHRVSQVRRPDPEEGHPGRTRRPSHSRRD